MENGIYNNVSIKDYHADRSHISATQIKWVRSSLAHYKWNLEHAQEPALHFDFGNAFELALLDESLFNEKVAVLQTQKWIAMANEGKKFDKPKNSGVYQAEQTKFIIENQGKYLIPDVGDQSHETIKLMLDSCHKNETIQKLLNGVEHQLSVYWTDEATGLNLKTRPDICQRKRNVVVNLKTIIDGSPESFTRELSKYDYPLQAAVEIKGCLESGLMSSVDVYYWLVVEKQAPYNATLYEFTNEDQEWVKDDLAFLLMKLERAIRENNFPGYTDRADNKYGILRAKIPPWYKSIYF